MPISTEGRVAVYIDFDNIVISRYNQKHGNGQFQKDKARWHNPRGTTTSAAGTKLAEAEVDVEAILDYASSFGTVAFSRAYADWSVPVNAGYQKQLINRAVELVQLFPLTAQMKNGADIRLAVDVMEDLFRLPDLTHVVIVAGDSDYVALAQRAKTLGRFVVGVGVAGGTSQALTSSCDKFADYDSLPGVEFGGNSVAAPAPATTPAPVSAALAPTNTAATPVKKTVAAIPPSPAPKRSAVATSKQPTTATNKVSSTATSAAKVAPDPPATKVSPLKLLVRAIRLVQQKEDSDWLNSSAVKNQMLRIDPSFDEASLKFKTFSDFVTSLNSNVEMREHESVRELRLRPTQRTPNSKNGERSAVSTTGGLGTMRAVARPRVLARAPARATCLPHPHRVPRVLASP
ncbi:NYN domain-containing protein [Salinibacterium sp. PAMC 21357]|uniref:NYN domain-containing protein n=1 Tax=Salinibacterium sp. PAMC 21357 TaxID=1112215 RepID=UPI00028A0335|nr:NYN domain-containing protein [Salinibacterium sp. PAMC 21357]